MKSFIHLHLDTKKYRGASERRDSMKSFIQFERKKILISDNEKT
jgi:hypothetical protein